MINLLDFDDVIDVLELAQSLWQSRSWSNQNHQGWIIIKFDSIIRFINLIDALWGTQEHVNYTTAVSITGEEKKSSYHGIGY